MSVREPAVAGYFYSSEREKLLEELKAAFLHKLGPRKLPERVDRYTGKVIGIISPHAGYIYSGHIAAHGYFLLAENGKPDIVFILGPNHHGIGAPIALSESRTWVTPLGVVDVDYEISKELASREPIIRFDETAHLYEHSIEVQLPFLQFIFETDFKIIPISMLLQSTESSKRVGKVISSIIEESGLKAYIVASSDFSHYVKAEKAAKNDKAAIEFILRLDIEKFYDTIIEKDISICGPGPIMTLMTIAENLGYRDAKVLKYANSGDVTGDYNQVVAYASISFSKGA